VTDTELHQAVQQWQNGDKLACWQVSEWFWQRQSAAAVRFMYELLDPHLEDYDRMQQATDLAYDAFWAAMEEMDLKVSGGKLLVTPTGRQKSVKGKMRDLFLGAVSEREVTAGDSLQWQGLESFAALFWRIWLLRCRDAMRSAISTYKGTTETYNPLTGKMDETPTRKAWERRSLEPTPGKHDEERQESVSEEELAGNLPDAETVVLTKENVNTFLAALKQVTQQLREDKELALAAVGDTLLRYAREQLDALSTGDHHPGAKASDAWKFVQQTLGLSQDAAYKRKSRFLQVVKDSPQSSVLLGHLKDD
jgi:hypothetical protein